MNPIIFVIAAAVLVLLLGIRIVRSTHRGLIERLGKYRRFAKWELNLIIPLVDRMIQVNITEQSDGIPSFPERKGELC